MSEETRQPAQLPAAPEGAPAAGARPRPETPPAPKFRRLAGESARAWEAFTIYVELGATRSLRRVAERLNKNETTVNDWSGKYDWVERAAAVDEAIARAKLQERVKAEAAQERKRVVRKGKLDRSNYDIGRRLRHRALQMLEWPLEETEKEEVSISEDGQVLKKIIIQRPLKWTFRDMMVAAEVSDRLMSMGLGVERGGRAVTGAGDTHINVQVNLGTSSPEERLRRARQHYLHTLLPDRERYIDRLASAEPGQPRRELEQYVDRMLVEWTAEDFRVDAGALADALRADDPLNTAINVTPGTED
jgi:hypothetical protein